MDITSTYRFARISPKKVVDVARSIQGMSASSALSLLLATPRKAAFFLSKVLKTAIADAESNGMESDLFVKKAFVGRGPVFRRFRPRARGSASAIKKSTSHISVVLGERAIDVVEEEQT